MDRYLALLRGINVGGRNKIPMAELRAAMEGLGYEDVKTYIASGNVVFSATGAATDIEDEIEAMLPQQFKLDSATIMVLVLDSEAMTTVVEQSPEGFGTEPDTYMYDVAFLKGITGDDVLPHVKIRADVDTAWATPHAFYFRRLTSMYRKSRLSTIASAPVYPSITIRSWSTTTKLFDLLCNP